MGVAWCFHHARFTLIHVACAEKAINSQCVHVVCAYMCNNLLCLLCVCVSVSMYVCVGVNSVVSQSYSLSLLPPPTPQHCAHTHSSIHLLTGCLPQSLSPIHRHCTPTANKLTHPGVHPPPGHTPRIQTNQVHSLVSMGSPRTLSLPKHL